MMEYQRIVHRGAAFDRKFGRGVAVVELSARCHVENWMQMKR